MIRQPGLHSILQASFFLVTRSRLETFVAGLIAPADRIQVNVVIQLKEKTTSYCFLIKKPVSSYKKMND